MDIRRAAPSLAKQVPPNIANARSAKSGAPIDADEEVRHDCCRLDDATAWLRTNIWRGPRPAFKSKSKFHPLIGPPPSKTYALIRSPLSLPWVGPPFPTLVSLIDSWTTWSLVDRSWPKFQALTCRPW